MLRCFSVEYCDQERIHFSSDPLQKINPISKILTNNFQQAYVSNEGFSLNE